MGNILQMYINRSVPESKAFIDQLMNRKIIA